MVNNWYKKMKKIFLIALVCMIAQTIQAQHDQYGKWVWPDMDGIPNPVWLKSTSYNQNAYGDYSYLPTTLYLEFGNTSKMCFVLEGDADPTTGEMELSFDNGDFMFYKFVKVEEFKGEPKYGLPSSTTFQFVVGDRYKKTINYDATNMLKQMANKRTATIRYKTKKGTMKTETFRLEGLEAILEVIYE